LSHIIVCVIDQSKLINSVHGSHITHRHAPHPDLAICGTGRQQPTITGQ
jgi:hypothetical protein